MAYRNTAHKAALTGLASAASASDTFTDIISQTASAAKAGAILDVQGCGISYHQSAGIANRKTQTPMPKNEKLRIASVTKIYTAAVIHKLVQDGRLDLDKSAADYLNGDMIKAIPNHDAPLSTLLNHTSGIPDYYDWKSYFFWDWTQPINPEKVLKKAAKRNPTNAAGGDYAYSNTNYQILALIAEELTQTPFKTLIEQYITEPLSLKNTQYNLSHPGGTIHGYGMKIRRGADTWKYAENTGADGGITATTTDLSHFLSAVFLDGGALENTGKIMKSVEVSNGKTRQYAILGAEVIESKSGYKLYGHTGDTYGYLTFAYAVPKFNATIIGHVNADAPDVFVKFLGRSVKTLDSLCRPT